MRACSNRNRRRRTRLRTPWIRSRQSIFVTDAFAPTLPCRRSCSERLRIGSWQFPYLLLNVYVESLVVRKFVQVSPVLARRFDVNHGGFRHPDRFDGIMKSVRSVMDFAGHARESEIAQARIHFGLQFHD